LYRYSQVLGHLKTMLVLAFGFFMLNNPFSSRNVCGILTALVVGLSLPLPGRGVSD
jgi:uncharacterized oligopeptide transporter (OPT) family protein